MRQMGTRMALISAVGAILLGGGSRSTAGELNAGTATGHFTAEAKKTELKHAYARWEKAAMDGTMGIAVVLTERPASAATLAAIAKAEYLVRPIDSAEVGGLMQFAFTPDGKVVSYQASRVGWAYGEPGGKASQFVLAGGRLRGAVAGQPEGPGGKKWEYAVTLDVPLGSRPAE